MAPKSVLMLVAATLLVAGCVGAEPAAQPEPSDSAPPPTVSAETGSIEGTVLDEEQRPVVGAEVAVLEANLVVKSDDGGRFVFNEITPGTYRMHVNRLGYVSTAKSVDVVAGDVATLTFLLEAIEIAEEGIHKLTTYDGLVQCSVSVFTPINACGGITGEDKDSWVFEVDRTRPFKEGVFELTWKATGPGDVGVYMELEVCDDLNREYLCTFGGTTSSYYKWADGKSPQILRLTDMPKGTKTFLTGAGAAFEKPPLFQQKFTIYMTHCWLEECAETYTALPPN